jgi:hypothetical protein
MLCPLFMQYCIVYLRDLLTNFLQETFRPEYLFIEELLTPNRLLTLLLFRLLRFGSLEAIIPEIQMLSQIDLPIALTSFQS